MKPEEISSPATGNQSDFCYAFRLMSHYYIDKTPDKRRTSQLNQGFCNSAFQSFLKLLKYLHKIIQ